MDEKDKELILEFKDKIPQEIKKHLKRVIVFGSRARGESSESSDLDVAVLVDRKNTEVEKKIEDTAYQLMWAHDFKPIISIKIFAQAQFQRALDQEFSFYRHIQEEGIVL